MIKNKLKVKIIEWVLAQPECESKIMKHSNKPDFLDVVHIFIRKMLIYHVVKAMTIE